MALGLQTTDNYPRWSGGSSVVRKPTHASCHIAVRDGQRAQYGRGGRASRLSARNKGACAGQRDPSRQWSADSTTTAPTNGRTRDPASALAVPARRDGRSWVCRFANPDSAAADEPHRTDRWCASRGGCAARACNGALPRRSTDAGCVGASQTRAADAVLRRFSTDAGCVRTWQTSTADAFPTPGRPDRKPGCPAKEDPDRLPWLARGGFVTPGGASVPEWCPGGNNADRAAGPAGGIAGVAGRAGRLQALVLYRSDHGERTSAHHGNAARVAHSVVGAIVRPAA